MYRPLPFILMLALPLGLILPGCSHLHFISGRGGTFGLPMELKRLLDDQPAKVSQLLLVTAGSRGDCAAIIHALEKKNDAWIETLSPIPAVIGRNGFAGSGTKREGDGRTPTGSYRLARTFGYAASVPTRMPYRQATSDDIWVDDPSSADYNQWTKRGETSASSFEDMLRSDNLYKYGVVIEYNTEPVVPGMGSAIFLHIWKGKDIGTSGCVAMEEQHIIKLFEWLDPARNPAIILVPPTSPGFETRHSP